MTLTSYPNGVSSFGIPQLGNGDIPTGGGEYFFVDSNNGSDGYEGSWDAPFATLDYAVGKCTANKGSVIVLKPNHAESIIADSGVDIDVAGVQVIGLGTGDDRPTFTFTTAVTADFKLAANNVSVKNLVFVAGIDALTGPIEISGDYCSVIDCEYKEDTTNNYETVDVVVTASTPLHIIIDGFKYVCDGGAGGTQNQSVIQLNGADFAIIRNCWLVADSATGVIEDATTSDQILIENCVIESSNTTPKPAIVATSTTTGSVVRCNIRVASGKTYISADTDLQFFDSFGTGTDNTSGEKISGADASYYIPQLGYRVQRTETMTTATSVDLFTVSGKCLVTAWTGEVTSAFSTASGSSDYYLRVKTANTALCSTSNNLAALSTGVLWSLSGASSASLGSTGDGTGYSAGVQGNGLANRVLGLSGGTMTVQSARTATTSAGAMVHTLYYIPLESSASIAAST
jgi:hypothetical protein